VIKRFTFITICTGILISGCTESSVTPTENIKFSRDVLPIFLQNCAVHGCHEQAHQNSDNLELTSWNSIMRNGFRYGAPIIPYNAYWSALVSHINYDTNLSIIAEEPRMPKCSPPITGEPLPPNQIHTIVQWINEGAKDDNGNVAFSNIPNKAFVACQASDLIAVINLDNNFLVRLVRVGPGGANLTAPHAVEADGLGRFFYTTHIRTNTVGKYDAYTYEFINSVVVDGIPAEIYINYAGDKGYLTNWDAGVSGSRKIFILNLTDMTLINTIEDARLWATHGGDFTHDQDYFITVSQLSEYVTIIRTSDDQIDEQIPVDELVPPNGNGTGLFEPIAVGISHDERYALISCTKRNEVRVLDLEARTFIKRIPTGEFPLLLHVSHDNRWCYVPNRNSNSVTVINMQTLEVEKVIEYVGVQPHCAAFTQDGHYAYVACESLGENNPYVHHPITGSNRPGTTAVIDVWGGHVKIKDIEMASFPNEISIRHYW
jgi:YVTN family beta-propeller protein